MLQVGKSSLDLGQAASVKLVFEFAQTWVKKCAVKTHQTVFWVLVCVSSSVEMGNMDRSKKKSA